MLQTYQLIYLSVATAPMEPTEIGDMLAIARKNNYSVSVSGLLVYHEQCFLQVLEGPKVAVEAIFGRVSTDPRHQHVEVQLRQVVDAKEFDGWSMAYIDGKNDAERLAGFVDYLAQLRVTGPNDSAAHSVLRRFQKSGWREKFDRASAISKCAAS